MNLPPARHFDAVVVGAGFFGASVALMLQKRGLSVLVLEREEGMMQRASYHNQARVHAGYHYPRSLITALRSSVNFPRFSAEFAECVVKDFTQYYAISQTATKVSAQQFATFMRKIDAPLTRASAAVTALFNPFLVAAVFVTREYAFDASRLARLMAARLAEAGVPILCRAEAEQVRRGDAGELELFVRHREAGTLETLRARRVFNCTYSQLNRLNVASRLPVVPLRHELTEIALVEPPPAFAAAGVTVMCGPFFSLMPFPARGLHSLSHVRYTPHFGWSDEAAGDFQPPREHAELARATAFPFMQKDAARFVPCLAESRYVDSLWEVKTILPLSDVDDSRPILFRPSLELPGLVHLMGGKIDNIFDIPQEMDELFA